MMCTCLTISLNVTLHYLHATILHVDPPYGLQYNDVEDAFGSSFDAMTQDQPAVYRTKLGGDSMLERLLEYDVADNLSERYGPNGIAINEENGDLAVVITDWNNPRTEIYSPMRMGMHPSTLNPLPYCIIMSVYKDQMLTCTVLSQMVSHTTLICVCFSLLLLEVFQSTRPLISMTYWVSFELMICVRIMLWEVDICG